MPASHQAASSAAAPPSNHNQSIQNFGYAEGKRKHKMLQINFQSSNNATSFAGESFSRGNISRFEKTDTLAGMKLIQMDKRPGHTYEYQDKETHMFKNQSY